MVLPRRIFCQRVWCIILIAGGSEAFMRVNTLLGDNRLIESQLGFRVSRSKDLDHYGVHLI